MGQRERKVWAGGAVLIAAVACSRPGAPVAADDSLRADLVAAQSAAAQSAVARPAERTQFVSALELGRAADPGTEGGRGAARAPRRASAGPQQVVRAPARVALGARTRPDVALARPVARVRSADDAPAAEPRAEDAPARPEPPTPAADPAPAPGPDEPVVAAPSRRPEIPTDPPPRRRGRTWDMGDVIRNAPFPINP